MSKRQRLETLFVVMWTLSPSVEVVATAFGFSVEKCQRIAGLLWAKGLDLPTLPLHAPTT